jgi:hypothetical protein
MAVEVFFRPNPSPEFTTCIHGILFFLMKNDKAISKLVSKKYDLTASLSMCKRIFSEGLETYDVLVWPSFGNNIALVLGVGGFSFSSESPAEEQYQTS